LGRWEISTSGTANTGTAESPITRSSTPQRGTDTSPCEFALFSSDGEEVGSGSSGRVEMMGASRAKAEGSTERH